MNKQTFKGPVFVFGMPRSGTKLLRDLLNKNKKIFIPLAESHFIPYFVNKYGLDFDLSTDKNQRKIDKEFHNTSFYFFLVYWKRKLEKEDFSIPEGITCWADLFEFWLRKASGCWGKKDVVFGDKTPGYINHMSLIKRVFPQSRFIHIIRDPRDYALSFRKSWGKNIFRAVERWRDTLERFEKDAQSMDRNDISVLYYEDLLDRPWVELKRLCGFLEVQYHPGMLRLDRPSEFLGDAKNQTEIVTDNKAKYLKELKPAQVQRIEEIVYPMAEKHSYPMHSAKQFVPLRRHEKAVYQIYDQGAILRHNIKRFGLFKGLYLSYIHHKKSSWQN
ncbi:MAG: hypothetical protein GF421_08120 [Candidatus Aminicenantes bacterium]|nr:hypothetical protein [Candidatus Aminicenantes bacterium]